MIGIDDLCNSFSACLTDECGCGEEHKVFYCADNSGCITLQQVSFKFYDGKIINDFLLLQFTALTLH